ncbi:hypothetical protein [Paenibacillus sanguinis]|uniref:hypothetical protein n=1 Tax=Paenibacillus sanguinis TaxID=225906 RepID=UPI00035E6A1B|nr:hypothetical protein [Paenibacillus sanguinis]
MYTLKRLNVIKQTESASKRDALIDQGYTLLSTEEKEKPAKADKQPPKEPEK